MLIPQVWLDLAEHGVRLEGTAAGDEALDEHAAGWDVVLSGPGFRPTTWDIKVFAQALRPSRLMDLANGRPGRATHRPLLVIVPGASAELLEVAQRLGISVLVAPQREDERTTGFLLPPNGPIVVLHSPRESVRQRPPGRPPWITYAVAFQLLDGRSMTQVALADRLSVTQGRVSQVMQRLPEVLTRDVGGWRVREPDRLLDWLVDTYPRPTLVSTWFSLDPVVSLAKKLDGSWARRRVTAAVSGEVAADALAPYANPTQLLIYLTRQIDATPDGLVPAPRSTANVTLAVPDDPFVLRSVTATPSGYSVVDPWRVVVDLRQANATQAADALTQKLRIEEGLPGGVGTK